MVELQAHDSPLHESAAPARGGERRKHPRLDCTGGQESVPAPDLMRPGASRPSVWRTVLIRLGLVAKPADPPPYGARIAAARDQRLPDIADRLESILAELDQLEAWREASEVCSAVERLRARSAES